MTTKNQHLLELFMEGKSIDEIHNLNPQYGPLIKYLDKHEIEKIIRDTMRRRCGWKKKQ